MPKNYRKRRADEDEEEEAGGAGEEDALPPDVLRARLEDTRRLQAERARARGVEAARLAGLATDGPNTGAAGAEGDRDGEEGLKHSFFAEQLRQDGEEDPQMLKYIEAELAKRRGAAGGGEAEAVPVEGWAAAEAALYETPAELRQDSPGRGAADQEGADRWLTGITEVQLPVEYKLKNIEETERAKAALLAAQRERADAGRRGDAAQPPPATDHARFATPRSMQPQATKPLDRPGGNVASDDLVAKRFRQAEMRRAQGRR